MSNQVLPAFPGWDITFRKSVEWRNTPQETGSGREFVLIEWTSPRYRYEMKCNLLRSGTERELQSFIAFFNQHRGSAYTWLFEDPDDRAVTAEPFGIGDAARTQFQLTRTWEGWVDPIYELNGAPVLYANSGDWRARYRLYDYARVNRSRATQNAFNWQFYQNDMAYITPNAATAPDGTATASVLIPDGNLSDHYLDSYDAFGDGAGYYTFSVHANDEGFDGLRLLVSFTGGFFYADFNLLNPSNPTVGPTGVGTVRAGAEQAPNGFWRIWVSGLVSVATGPIQRFQILGPGGVESFAGDGVKGVLVWGWQLEKAQAPTRYIPSLGVAGSSAPADYTLGAKGMVTMSAAPAVGTTLDWSGAYFWRCRFDTDILDVDRFLAQMYQAGKVSFKTVKP